MRVDRDDVLLAHAEASVAEHLGLDVSGSRRRDLVAALEAVARARGRDPGAAARAAGPWTRRQLDELVPHLTVGETYFFRDRPVLEAVADDVARRVSEREPHDREVRVWSAGCATGEEPYSLAMLLHGRLADAGEAVSILGADVNAAALSAAEAGVYRPWSLRAAPHWAYERYLRRCDDGSYELTSEIRQRVRFERLNLASEDRPWPSTSTPVPGTVDVLLCRNVLMYFTSAQAAAVLDRFAAVLAPGGILVLGPVEPAGPPFVAATLDTDHDVRVYRRADDSPAGPPAATRRRGIRDGGKGPATARPRTGVRRSSRARARACANSGRLDEAARWCRRAIAASPTDASARYLLASIELERGRDDSATEHLEHALRLAPGLVVAHVALANLCSRAGRHDEAGHHLERASTLLDLCDDASLLPEGDGLTAGALARTIQALRTTRAGRG